MMAARQSVGPDHPCFLQAIGLSRFVSWRLIAFLKECRHTGRVHPIARNAVLPSSIARCPATTQMMAELGLPTIDT
jgi:hypothetical protein